MTVDDDTKKLGIIRRISQNTFERRFFMHFSLNLFCGHVMADVLNEQWCCIELMLNNFTTTELQARFFLLKK